MYTSGYIPEILNTDILVPNWMVIIMQKLDLTPLQRGDKHKRQQAISILLEAGFVHGDLRNAKHIPPVIQVQELLL